MTMQKKPIQITNEKTGHTFTICKLPAIDGRELLKDYIEYNLPVVGNKLAAKQAMLKLISYVTVALEDGTNVALSTNELINNHVEDTDELTWLETEMVSYNFGFLGDINPAPLIMTALKMFQKISSSMKTWNPLSASSLAKE